MNTSLITARRVRSALISVAVAGSALAGFAALGGPAEAAPAGYVTILSCSTMSGQVTYQPGLVHLKDRQVKASLLGSFSNCTGELGSPGTGTVFASLSGSASLAAENFSGTFTIDWPGGSLNPSSGTLSVSDQSGNEVVSGYITSGAMTGDPVTFGYVTTVNTGTGSKYHPVTAQQFINSAPLVVQENIG